MMDFKAEYKNKIKLIDDYIQNYLDTNFRDSDSILLESMKYSVLNGGKRLRSILCMEFCRLFGGCDDDALPFACAIELIHAYSLVHDDLPAMDNADMRRGQLSCHAKYGETMGILCGDALLNSAFELMSNHCKDSSSISAMRVIAKYAGALGMINGQVLDIDISNNKKIDKALFLKMIEQKTMALIKASVISGAMIGKCDEDTLKELETFSYSLGIAFQIRDDFEDIIEDGDDSNDSPNFITYLGEDKARELLNEHTNISLSILKKYNCEFLIMLHDYLFKNV